MIKSSAYKENRFPSCFGIVHHDFIPLEYQSEPKRGYWTEANINRVVKMICRRCLLPIELDDVCDMELDEVEETQS